MMILSSLLMFAVIQGYISGSQTKPQETLSEGLTDCKVDIKASLCDSSTISEKCKKNPIVRYSCQFSCSLSGQLWGAAWRGDLPRVNAAIAKEANPLCQHIFFHKLNISKIGYHNRTAIHLAALANRFEVVKALLDADVDVNLQTAEGITPTLDASRNSSIDALNILIEHNANVNLPTTDGDTPLMAASRRNNLSVVKALISANASIDITRGSTGVTALYYAAWYGNQDVALLLIEHNANVNIGTSDGETPLMGAAEKGQLSLAKALINANASLDVTGGWAGTTALHYAARNNNKDIAVLLIESGAYTRMPNKAGDNPADVARLAGHNHLAELIESYTNQCRSGALRQKWC